MQTRNTVSANMAVEPLQGVCRIKARTLTENSILFISAESEPAASVEAILREVGGAESSAVRRVEALFDGLRVLQEGPVDVILSDMFLPDGQGLATLRHLQQHAPQTPVIAMVRLRDRDTGVTAVRQGAYDFFAYEELDAPSLKKSIDA